MKACDGFQTFPEDCRRGTIPSRRRPEEICQICHDALSFGVMVSVHHPEADHRKNVFEKVMRGKERG